MELKQILCPIDFSEFSTRAYRHALSVAEHYEAKLFAMHVVELWRYPYADYGASEGDYAKFHSALSEGGEQKLKEFLERHAHPLLQPDLMVCEGRAPDSILAFAEKKDIDLIVMGTHGRRGFDRLMLGSATDRVMREACCPVLAVCKPTDDSVAAAAGRHHVHRLTQILVCTDFSENSQRALDYAVSAAAEYDAALTILHVVDESRDHARTQEAMATGHRELDKLATAEKCKDLKVSTELRSGKPYQRIIEYARETAPDVIAMGVRGAGALDRAVFGSTTYRVIQLGPSPVLAVHV